MSYQPLTESYNLSSQTVTIQDDRRISNRKFGDETVVRHLMIQSATYLCTAYQFTRLQDRQEIRAILGEAISARLDAFITEFPLPTRNPRAVSLRDGMEKDLELTCEKCKRLHDLFLSSPSFIIQSDADCMSDVGLPISIRVLKIKIGQTNLSATIQEKIRALIAELRTSSVEITIFPIAQTAFNALNRLKDGFDNSYQMAHRQVYYASPPRKKNCCDCPCTIL